MWLHHPSFTNVLREFWNQTPTDESFLSKAKHCGDQLLQDLQEGPQTGEIIQKLRENEMTMDNLLVLEESMWHQRSRVLWLKEGDRNSRFFHQKATQRKRRNTIEKMKNRDGQWIRKPEEIEFEVNN